MRRSTYLFVTTVALASVPSVVGALSPAKQLAVCGSGLNNFFGFQPWYACLEQKYGEIKIASINDIFLILFPALEWLVKAGALVAAGMIFYLLIMMMTARGNAGKIATAATGIRDAVIGFIICLISVALINFVQGAIQG